MAGALIPRLQSFQSELLTQEANLAGLAAIHSGSFAEAETLESPQRASLDMDSTEIPVHGQRRSNLIRLCTTPRYAP